MQPIGLTAKALAARMKVSVAEISALLSEEVDVDSELAARLARAFDTTIDMWLRLQRAFDAEDVRIARERTVVIASGRSVTLTLGATHEELGIGGVARP